MSEKSINLLIVHHLEEEAERILSLLRNYQIAVRPLRCIDEDNLVEILESKPVDLVLCQMLQTELPITTVVDKVNHSFKDIPVIALLERFDSELIQEGLESGCNNYCTPSLPQHMRHVIIKEMDSLRERRRNTTLALKLKDLEKQCSLLLDSSKQAIAYIHDGMHVYSNQSYRELFAYDDEEELEVTPFLNLIAKQDLQRAKSVLRDIGKHKLPEEDLEFQLMKSNNETFQAFINISGATIKGEQCAQFIINLPATNPEAEKELFAVKNKDLTTGFFNRSYFHDQLAQAIDQAKVKRGDSLIMLQLDNAENLQKDLGVGRFDQLIIDFADFLKGKLGEDVVYSRYTDISFIVQIKLPIEKAEKVAEKLLSMIAENLFTAGDRSLNLTVSIAVTQLTKDSKDPDSVVEIVSQEITQLHEKGGNTVAVFDPAEEEKRARAAAQAWIDRITEGLKHDRFCLHYQPVVNIEGEEKEVYETLVRLHSDDGTLMPSQFIPVAEKYGFIKEIDRWVVTAALKSIASAGREVMLMVKLSHHSLTDPSFPQWLMTQFRATGVSSDKIAIEIKESELVTHAQKMKPIVKALKNTHCTIIVEKFGSGLNSFSILKHFPVDLLKVDVDLMENFSKNEENQQKVKDLIQKAHTLGKQVICEQIEDATTMSQMWKMAVNYVQGDFIAPPNEKMEQVE